MARGAHRARVLSALAAGALAALLAAPASAQNHRSLSQVERDRQAENARARQLRSDADAARHDIAALDRRLAAAAQRRAEAEAQALAAEQRLAELGAQAHAYAAQQARMRESFENAVIMAAFAQRGIALKAQRAGIFARAAAPALAAAERQSAYAAAEAEADAREVGEEQLILAEAQSAIDAERQQTQTLIAERRGAQSRFSRDAEAAERRVRTLAAEARTLRELAQRVQRASATRRARAPAGPSVIPSSWRAPAQGQMVRSFGARTDGGAPAQGATLRTRPGAQVIAPAGARVAFAGPFRSYGRVLILNLDGGYSLVLTGLGETNVRVDDVVVAGQPLGEMPASDTAAPELYVEVRRSGQPVDPGRWLGAQGLAAARTVREG